MCVCVCVCVCVFIPPPAKYCFQIIIQTNEEKKRIERTRAGRRNGPPLGPLLFRHLAKSAFIERQLSGFVLDARH